jgi:Protein of unknown function (DUF5131)
VEPLLEDLGRMNLEGIDWMIVGGDSGAGARPLRKESVLQLRDQCRRNKIPFFFKQWGGVGKAKAGRKLDGRTYDEFPRRVHHPVMSVDECALAAREIEANFTPPRIFRVSLPGNQTREVRFSLP